MLSWTGLSYIQVFHWNKAILSHFCCTYPSKLSISKQSAFPQKHKHSFLHIFGPGQMTSWSLVTFQELMQVNSLSTLFLSPSHKQAHTASLGQFASSSAWIQPVQTSMKAFPQANMTFWIHPSIPPYPWWQRVFTEVNKQHFKATAFAFLQRSSVLRCSMKLSHNI